MTSRWRTAEGARVEERPETQAILRWLWTWIAVALIFAVVLLGFLVGIIRSLGSVDGHLRDASAAVTTTHGNVATLPDVLEELKLTLDRIALGQARIPKAADETVTTLSSIQDLLAKLDGSLDRTQASLGPTSRSLSGTARSLSRTTSPVEGAARALVQTSRGASRIRAELAEVAMGLARVQNVVSRTRVALRSAQARQSLGTAAIPPRLRSVNRDLRGIHRNAAGIHTSIGGINEHLVSICGARVFSAPVASVLSVGRLARPGPCG